MRRTLVLAVASVLACQRSPSEPSAFSHESVQPSAGGPSAQPTPHHPSATAPELGWTDPPSWRRVAPSSEMRRAQYVIPRAPGVDPASHDTELTVFYFGVGQGGGIDDNLNRWYQQVTQPDGRATRDVAVRESHTVGDLHVTVTYVTGQVNSAPMAATGSTAQGGFALLGAIVETNAGPWFFKMTGPQASVVAARPAFDAMIQTMHMR